MLLPPYSCIPQECDSSALEDGLRIIPPLNSPATVPPHLALLRFGQDVDRSLSRACRCWFGLRSRQLPSGCCLLLLANFPVRRRIHWHFVYFPLEAIRVNQGRDPVQLFLDLETIRPPREPIDGVHFLVKRRQSRRGVPFYATRQNQAAIAWLTTTRFKTRCKQVSPR